MAQNRVVASKRAPPGPEEACCGLLGPLLEARRPELAGTWRTAVLQLCSASGEDSPPYLCGRCHCVAYSSAAAQKEHWSVHKSTCSQGPPPAPVLYVHTVWGLWDKCALPDAYRRSRVGAARLLPSSMLAVWSRPAIELLLDDDWRSLWSALPRGVCQADVARYLIALHVGGMYLDADAELLQAPPPGEWQVLLLIEHKVPDVRFLGPRESPHLVRMAQFMFATAPNHEFWRAVLDLSYRRCSQRLREGGDWSDGDVLWATGPDVVTTVFHEHFSSDPTIEVRLARDFVRHECKGAWRQGADCCEE